MADPIKLASAWASWQASNLLVRNKLQPGEPVGKLVPFMPSDQQLRVLTVAARQRCAGLPIRLLLLKHRQGGWSTQSQGMMFADSLVRDHRSALTCAHKAESSDTLFRIGTTFNDHIPARLRRPTDYSNRREILWSEPHGSTYSVATAGSDDLGRGSMLTSLHASEVAFWPSQATTWASVMQAWAESDPSAMLFVESTANGVGDLFHDLWRMATERKRARPDDLDGLEPMFLGWLQHPEYRRALPRGVCLDPLSDREQMLRILGADDAQLWWRRRTIDERLAGDEDLFCQEYPATPDEAFVSSGRPAIPPQIVAEHARTAEDGRQVVLTRRGDEVTATDSPAGGWTIYREPVDYYDYAIGADVAEGRASDQADERSDPDYSAAVVLDRRDLTIVATFRGRIDPDLFGDELLAAALWYGKAWMTPEVNNNGWATIARVREWPFLMGREGPEDRDHDTQPLNSLGWRTTGQNRDFLIDEWIAACRPDPVRGFEGKVLCRSRRLADEEGSFIRTKTGKREHRPGEHDDLLFAAMIAWQVHQRCPRQYRDRGPTPRPPTRQQVVWTGAIDPGVMVGGGDDDCWTG